MADAPREKRQRVPKVPGDEFTQYTSSDCSSSDAESEQESEYNSEDDPERPWCVCRKPHGGKFMISCDICKDWFHGHCVGVTKMMGDRFERDGKEWYCGECQEKLRADIPRSAIPPKIVKREKKKSKHSPSMPGKRGRGRPRKSESLAKEGQGATRSSQRSSRKSSSSSDPNTRLRKGIGSKFEQARSESFGEFEDQQRLKQLIKERKKEFFYKRQLAEQQKAAKRNELGIGRQSLTASLSDSLDSLASSTSTPNMSNLPINIKSEHRERSEPNIVLQIRSKQVGGGNPDDVGKRIVTAIVRSPKKSKTSESVDPVANELFTAEPLQIKRAKISPAPTTTTTPSSSTTATATAAAAAAATTTTTTSASTITASSSQAASTPSNGEGAVRRRSDSSSSTPANESDATGDPNTTTSKKQKDSESGTPNGASGLTGSKLIAQKIKESLESRSNQFKDLSLSTSDIEKLADEIEGQLNECFKEGSPKYLNKFRSLVFNLRDPKNQGLVRNVLAGEIPPAKLVRMSPDEMASHELAKWRERENKHSIELIKRDAQLAAQQVIVKKTHKGEEVISTPANEPEDPVTALEKQEAPSTPSKDSGAKFFLDSLATASPSKRKFSESSNADTSLPGTSATPSDDPKLAGPDSTEDHKNHVFETSCKLCTKQQTEGPDLESGDKQDSVKVGSGEPAPDSQAAEPPVNQPKRFRVSIDTNLDPADLSRLRDQPLIKPAQPATLEEGEEGEEAHEYSPSRVTSPYLGQEAEANHRDLVENENEDEEEEELYDPEALPVARGRREQQQPMEVDDLEKNVPCWSGTIAMPDIAKFSALARPVSGSTDFMRDEVDQNLSVCGRIAPDQVQGYIKKLRSTKSQILAIQLFPSTADDKANFDTFFDYLYSRNRYGVIQTRQHVLKDFYVIPIHENGGIPEILKPIKGPGIDRRDPNCLVGLLVRSKRLTPTSSTTYTPSQIK